MSEDRKVPEYTPHPFNEIFPPASDEERKQLEERIKKYGLRQKIIIDKQNRILDGLTRYRACLAVGVTPQFQVFEGTEEEARQLIWDANMVRRHLATSVKVAVGADWTELERGQHKSSSGNSQISVSDAAKQLNVSASHIQVEKRTKRVSPDLHALVKAHVISVNAAEHISNLPQNEIADNVQRIRNAPSPKAAKAIAREAAAKAKATNARGPKNSSRKDSINGFPAAYAVLFEELDQLPKVLGEHPMSALQLEELIAELRKALNLSVAIAMDLAKKRNVLAAEQTAA